MNARPVGYAVAVILLAGAWLAWCHDPAVRKAERQRQQFAVTDSVARVTDHLRAQLAYSESTAVGTIRRQLQANASVRGEIARLKRRLETTPADTGFQSPAIAVRDSIIARQDSVIQRQDSTISLYAAMRIASDSLTARLVRERDAFQVQRNVVAKQSRFACVGGLGASVGITGQAAAGLSVTCGIRL